MALNDRESVKAICAAIIFSTRFQRELEKAKTVGDPDNREDTIIFSREQSIEEAVEIAGQIIDQCEANQGIRQ
ncbi:hypothetical protein IT571_07335 [Candidatus Sumerlaeota bacterium]|nr:hypothetical protein [Candidatus Sumerlaeota bacterium]